MARIRLKNRNYVKKERVLSPPFWRKKGFWLAGILAYAVWICGLRRPVYLHLYGMPAAAERITPMTEVFENVDRQECQSSKIGGYEILYKIRKKYIVFGRVVYIDWYRNAIGTWFRSAMSRGTYLYDAVVPVDVSVLHGATAADGNWQKIKFFHEERLLRTLYRFEDNPVLNQTEINNNHVIPASPNILRALKIVKNGEPVYMEGYLVDWKGTGDFAEYAFNTALTPGEFSKEKAGGLPTGLCRQFYVTKIVFDGFVFE